MSANLTYWKDILNLNDWDIKVKTVRQGEMDEENQGEVRYNFVGKQAIIKLLDPIDWTNKDFDQDKDKTLIHELLHLKFAVIDDIIDKPIVHQLLNDIAKAIIETHRRSERNGNAKEADNKKA